jgi:acyl-CoA reductase-like NAD-dependent aldehyde dehydrogenase
MSAIPQSMDAAATNEFKLLINGKLVQGAARLDVINPATGKVLTTCARADAAQLQEAIAAAKTAFGSWSKTPITERRRALLTIADALAARSAEFARLLTEEQGKPLAQATTEVGGAAYMIRALAQMDLPPKVLRDNEQQRIVQHRVPLGVVAAITPWNFPLFLLVMKVTPALLAGNTVVAKPAPTTPLTSLLFGEMCVDMLPPGVLNIIVDQNELGDILTRHPDVAKVAFTGSTATGKKVMSSGAATLKHITLELGGNDAAIVLDDVNVADVAPKLFDGAMRNSGQICVAIKRLFVPDAVYEAMCTELAALARRAVLGNGLDAATELGPLQNRVQFERVKGLLEDTKANGKIIAGGEALDREGYFMAPTIVRDIADDSRLVREEQFGPALPVLRYSDLGDAIARANDTDYGLGGSVWSSDLARAHEVAMQLSTGSVWVNKSSDLAPDVPFSGAKQSGFGSELGQAGLEEYTQAKIVNISK